MNVLDCRHVDGRGSRGGWIVAALLALYSCGGCWEEIHYTPSAEAPEESTEPAAGVAASPDDANERDAMPLATESIAEEPSLLPPSPSDLFAAEDGEADTSAGADEETVEAPDEAAAPDEDATSILPTPSAIKESSDASADGGSMTGPISTEPATPEEQRLAWQAVSKWSLAAAIHAKGLPNSPQTPIIAEASQAAEELGITLPELPTVSRDDGLEAAVIEGLRGELAVAVRNAFANRLGEAEAAAAELAIRSHLLLLTYSPRHADAALEAKGLRRAGEASGLPTELWTPLVELVAERASFLEVRQGVFDLHRRVEAHLALKAASDEP